MSNCKVIALTNQKGGVGKTTTAVNLGVGLAKQDKKVLLIDADAQANLTMALGYNRPDDIPVTLSTVMQNIIDDKSFDTSEGVLHHSEGVDLLPSNIELSGFEVRLINAMSRERVLKTYVNEAKKNYDYVLIDCMPSLGMITINALAAADSVIIPTQPHYLSAKGLELLLRSAYGYQCYNQINNGNKKKREALGLDTDGYCDIKMIIDWKLDFMAKELLEHIWQDRKTSVLIAIDLIKRYYKDDRLNENQHDAVSIKAKIEKAQTRLTNLIAMRADGELSKEEYQAMRTPIDTEIQQLQAKLNQAPSDEQPQRGLELDGIINTLNKLIDFSGTKVSEEVINQFIYRVTPTSDTTFDWYVNLNGTADVKATFTAEGRKSRAVVKLEEIEQISSLHRKENEDNGMFLKNPPLFLPFCTGGYC